MKTSGSQSNFSYGYVAGMEQRSTNLEEQNHSCPPRNLNSRRQDENGVEMFTNVKRTYRACRAFVFAHERYCFVAFS